MQILAITCMIIPMNKKKWARAMFKECYRRTLVKMKRDGMLHEDTHDQQIFCKRRSNMRGIALTTYMWLEKAPRKGPTYVCGQKKRKERGPHNQWN